MSEVLMALGNFRFSVDQAAYEQLSRTTAYRWASQERIDQLPAMQYIGSGTDTIELDGTIYPFYKGGVGQLDAMRAEAEKGTPMSWVAATDGVGKPMGKWCITRIQETQSNFSVGGIPQKVKFQLSLSRYGEEKNGTV